MRIGLIGCGAWGEKWARVIDVDPQAELTWIADPDGDTSIKALAYAGPPPVYPSALEAYGEHETDAVVIACPPADHYSEAIYALTRGLHVIVEKPVALEPTHAARMVRLARSRGRVLLPAHTFLFSAPVLAMLNRRIEIGVLRYARFEWLGPGRVRDDIDVLWSVGPHPLSILHHLRPDWPYEVQGHMRAWLRSQRADVCRFALLWEGFTADVALSWVDPVKVRRVTLLGSDGGMVCEPTQGELTIQAGGRTETVLVTDEEPLATMLREFVLACAGVPGLPTVADREGTWVVGLLAQVAAATDWGVKPELQKATS